MKALEEFIKFEHVTHSYDVADENGNDQKDDFTSLHKIYFAVEDICLAVPAGSFTAIIGRNGSGKSTIARMMNGLIVPTEGTVWVNQINTADDELIWDIRSNVGMVFQNPDNQIIGTSVEEDVAFGPENLGVAREEMIKRIDWALETVGLTKVRKFEPHLLSGGQKQRVAIAGILAMQPKCIVLDEATAMLDPTGRKEVMRVVKQLNEENHITIIHITHHMDEVTQAERVILIDNGHIRMTGTPKEIFKNAEVVRGAGLEVPQVTQLFQLLRERGISVPADVITIDEAVSVLRAKMEERTHVFDH